MVWKIPAILAISLSSLNAFADHSKMIQLHNKEQLMKIATEIDLPIPKTSTIENVNEIQNIAKAIEYPAVIKLKDATSSIGIQYAYSEDEFVYIYKHTNTIS